MNDIFASKLKKLGSRLTDSEYSLKVDLEAFF